MLGHGTLPGFSPSVGHGTLPGFSPSVGNGILPGFSPSVGNGILPGFSPSVGNGLLPGSSPSVGNGTLPGHGALLSQCRPRASALPGWLKPCPESLAQIRQMLRLSREVADRHSSGRRKAPDQRVPQPSGVVPSGNQGDRSRDDRLTPGIKEEPVAVRISVHPRHSHIPSRYREMTSAGASHGACSASGQLVVPGLAGGQPVVPGLGGPGLGRGG